MGGTLARVAAACFVLARGVLLLAEGEEGGGVVGRFGDGGLEALEALVGGGCGGAADVVLEGAELDAAGGGEEGLLGDGEVRVHALGDLPGDGVFDVEEAGEFGGVCRAGGDMRSWLTSRTWAWTSMRPAGCLGSETLKLPTMT